MQFFASLGEIPAGFGPTAVAIGKFDGVHAGHRQVIAALREVAERESLTSTIVTFDRHPLALLRPEACPPPLVSNAQKVELLGVLVVGLLSIFDPILFPAKTVWSGFGAGYGYVPLVLPILGMLWLYHRRPRPVATEAQVPAQSTEV